MGRTIALNMNYLCTAIAFALFCNSLAFSPRFKRNAFSYTPSLSTGHEGEPLYLTPFLEKGMHMKAQNLAHVNPPIGNVTSYSGFFTVNKECESNLFFWFFPAQTSNWEELPLLLWLQGGPGVSSLYGLFLENGPFEYTADGLKSREYSWNRKINMIYIDQPVGAGFSFTGKNCYAKNQTTVGDDLYNALVQFHQLFPNFQDNKLFICGQSYAGHYIPAIGYAIHKHNPTAETKINLGTMMIGNGWSDPIAQNNYGPFLYEIGMIDYSQKEELDRMYKEFVEVASTNDLIKAAKMSDKISDTFQNYISMVDIYNFLPNAGHPELWATFVQSTETRKSLHVGSGRYSEAGGPAHYNLKLDIVTSVKPWVEELLEEYPIVFYNGQLDIICSYSTTIKLLRTLHWSGQDKYLEASRRKWCVDNELAGYLKGEHNLYDVLVRASGHAVPADQPKWAFELVNSIVSGPPNDPFHLLSTCPY